MSAEAPARRPLAELCPEISVPEATIEAAWLAALLLVPLAFWPLSDSAVNPVKASLFEVLFAGAAAAWLVKIATGGRAWRPGFSGGSSRRWMLATVGVVVAQALSLVLATMVSLDPALSWHGTFADDWGVRHQLEMLGFFLLVAGHLRDRHQVERVLGVIILGSVPVVLYALLQHSGLDPLPWFTEPGKPLLNSRLRTMAALGNPTLLGAYLLYPILVTLGVLGAALAKRSSGARAPFNWRHLGLVFALLLQIAALLLSSSRAPFLALLAGLSLVAVGWLRTRPIRRAWRWFLLSVFIGLVALGAGSIRSEASRGGPIAPGIARLANLDLEGPSVTVRRKVWRETLALVHSRTVVTSSRGADRHVFWRPLLGYGPHAAELALPSRGRAHNRLLEALVTTGWVGLFAEIGLHSLVLGLLLSWCFKTSPLRFWLSALIVAVASGAAACLAIASDLTELVAVAGAGGAILGLLGVLIGSGTARAGEPHESLWPRVPLVAGLCAHLVNQSFSDDYLVLRLLFWLVLGSALVAIDSLPHSFMGEPESAALLDGPTGTLCWSVLGLWLLVGFSVPNSAISSGFELLGTLPWQMWYLLCGALLMTVVLTGPLRSSDRRKLLVVFGLLAGAATAYAGLLAQSFGVASSSNLSTSAAGATMRGQFWLTGAVVAMVLLSLACLTVARGPAVLSAAKNRGSGARAWSRRLAAAALGAALGVALLQAPFASLLAHSLAGEAGRIARMGRGPAAAQLAQEAARTAPHAAYLENLAGRIALDAATSEPDAKLRNSLLKQAESSLVRAMDRSPFDSDTVVNLGRYRVQRAVLEPGHETKKEQLKNGVHLYELALRMRPSLPKAWQELAGLHLRLDNPEAARSALERGLLIQPNDPELLSRLGELNRVRRPE